MRDLEIELDTQDDEIIDLEDIIEMPDRPIDEDEDLDLDVEILDVDSDFEPEEEKPAGKAPQPAVKDQAKRPRSKDEDLLNSFGDEAEDDETLFDQIASMEPAGKILDKAAPKVFEEDEESLLDELMDEREAGKPGTDEEKNVELRQRAAAAIKVPEDARPVEVESEPAVSGPLESAQPPVQPSVDLSKTAEELIGRIESNLQEHIRVMVESRLPDLVRSIISEEIEKLKNENQ
jgi:hypothetical protein